MQEIKDEEKVEISKSSKFAIQEVDED